ncbi:hypothetical protein ScPMuIL_016638 [Solemya velum]
MDASFSEAFLVDNDELDLIGSDVEGSSGYGSESDGYASLSDFPMVSTDDLTRPTRECDVMKVFYQLILKHLREQTTNKKSKTSITSTTNLVIPVVKTTLCGGPFELDDLRRACWNFVEYCLESGKSGRLKKRHVNTTITKLIYRHYNMEDVRKLKYGQKKETTV